MSHASTAETPTAKSSPPHPGVQRLRGHPWLSLLAVTLGVMLVALDGTVVAIASPAIQKDVNYPKLEVPGLHNGHHWR